MLKSLSENVIVGWVRRRLLEVGGIVGLIVPFVMAMPPDQQAVLVAIITGQGGGLSIAALFGLGVYLFGQWRSWRATVNPQVVTSDKKKIEVPVLTEAEARAITGWDGPVVDRSRR
ncbi:MAG: hypothetical protein ABW063_09045 [Caulobacter sp.]